MAKFKIFNPDLSHEERTHLSSDYSSGVTVTVRNNNNFTDDYYIIVGEPGQESTEAAKISSTTGTATITIPSALGFTHAKGSPVRETRWNQWAVERAATKTGSYSPITSSPSSDEFFNIDWDNADKATLINDDAGASTTYYKWRPYNSTTATYGSYSDPFSAAGSSKNEVGYLLEQLKKNPMVSHIADETIIDYFNDLQDLV